SLLRVAFIVEGVTLRISAKNQRKFAILTISDGTESHELPIWSDLYEQHSALIRDNQLLFALLQKEVQEGKMRLQCRYLSDLAKDEQELLSESQSAYDLAKKSLTREKKAMEKETKLPGKSRLRLTVDADLMRLSHILAIKEVFRAYPGSVAI